MTSANAEIGQISFYLSKEKQTFDSVIDSEADLAGKLNYLNHDFNVDGISCRFLYFQTSTQKTNPPWLNFANEQLPDGVKIPVFASQVLLRCFPS